MYLEEFYGADIEKSLVGTSIPATEHSVMEAYGQNEFESYKRLITEVYPKGFVSIVSDTWNLWKVLNEVIRPLKDVIMAREGRVVIRPDSGDPVTIICGDPNSDDENERKGVLQILWEIFGGTITEKGYRQLDSHIGCIYGDAITLLRCEEICQRLLENKFASTNMVYGIGSFTYQYNTRDTFGFALKTTFGVFGGEEKKLFKDPVTDTGKFKKSHCGMVVVRDFEGQTRCIDGMFPGTRAAVLDDLLEDVFIDGELVREESLEEIRGRLLG
jgi:nicotinamide phosphoribosyltransferase